MNTREFVENIAQREAAELITRIEKGELSYQEAINSLNTQCGDAT